MNIRTRSEQVSSNNISSFPGRHPPRGFTLIELIIVIVLIGILAVVGSSRFFDNNTFSQRGLFDDTLAALRYAQKRSIATQCQVQVTITTNSGYQLSQDASCNASSPNYNQSVRNPGSGNADYANDRFASQNIALAVTPAMPVTFDALGRSVNGDMGVQVGSLRITIVGETGLICGPSGADGCP